jgi:hypothetical protein
MPKKKPCKRKVIVIDADEPEEETPVPSVDVPDGISPEEGDPEDSEGLEIINEEDITDEEDKSFITKLKDILFPKAITATTQGCAKPASSFLVVEDPKKPSTWHMPVKDCSGKPDHRLMAAAKAALTSNYRGNPYAGPNKDEAIAKLKAMYASEKLPWASKSSLSVFKDNKGQYHAFGIVTNKWRDRDVNANPKNGGEIITEAAHKDFISFLDKHPEESPELQAWHTPGTGSKSKAEWWQYHDGFVLMSWPLTEKEAEGIIKAEEKYGPLGMSHGFITASKDVDGGLIHQYRSIEASHLPLDKAANLFTDFAVARTEAKMTRFADEKRKYLAEIFGEDVTAGLEAETEQRAKELEAQGVQSKEYEAENPTTKALEMIATGISELRANVTTVLDGQKSLDERLSKVEKTDDEKVADTIRPRISKQLTTQPGEQGETISDDKAKELAPAGSEKSWFQQAHTGIH